MSIFSLNNQDYIDKRNASALMAYHPITLVNVSNCTPVSEAE
jgi:hypothetical protein